MKKVLALALTLVMVLSFFTFAFSAAEVVAVASGSYAAAKAGDTVTLTVKLDSTTVPLTGFDFIVKYDTSKLEVVSTEKEIKGTVEFPHGSGLGATIAYGGNADQIKVLAAEIDELQTTGCTLFVINFKATADVSEGDITLMQTQLINEASVKLGDDVTSIKLTCVKANTEALAAAIADAKAIDSALYTDDSFAALTAAIAAGEALVGVVDANKQGEIDAAAKAITDAKAALVLAKTFEELTEAIKAAEALDTTKYSEKSVAALAAAIEAAKALTETATKNEIATAYAAIEAAKAALMTPAQEALAVKILEASNVDTSVMTAEQVKALEDAIAAALVVLGNDEATDDQINAAIEALTKAMAAKAPVTPVDPGKDDDKNPDTGDANVVLYVALGSMAILSLAALAFVVAKKRNSNI